jgi:hypothetical protein
MTRPAGMAASASQRSLSPDDTADAAVAAVIGRLVQRVTTNAAAANRRIKAPKPTDHVRACVCSGRNGSISVGYAKRAAKEPRLEAA